MIKSLKPGKKLLNIDEYECYCDSCGELCEQEKNGSWKYFRINDFIKHNQRLIAEICFDCLKEKLSFIKFRKTKEY